MKRRRKSRKKSAKFERCVRSVKRSSAKAGRKANPWAVCHAAVGRDPSEHRAHPTKYKISVRQHGASRPSRTWGPYESRQAALEAITQKRDEARRMGWNVVFSLREPTEAWGTSGPLRRVDRDPKRMRVERGPTGAAVWHLPDSQFIILWTGPGSRLRFGTNKPGTSMMFIEHPSADDSYNTFKAADAAVKAFVRAGTTSSRDPGKNFVAYEFDLARGKRTNREMMFSASNLKEAAGKLVYTLNLSSHGWMASPSGRTVGRKVGDIGWHIVEEGSAAHGHIRAGRDPRSSFVNRPRNVGRPSRSLPSQHEYEHRESSRDPSTFRDTLVNRPRRDPKRKSRSYVSKRGRGRYMIHVYEADRNVWHEGPEYRTRKEAQAALREKEERHSAEAWTRTSRSLPSQHEYESREIHEFLNDLKRVEKAPLADRKEGAREFAQAMAHDPELVAERIGWLLDGNYGQGGYIKAREVARSPRMNRVAWLTQTVGSLEWQSPWAMTRASWKKMTPAQKSALDSAVTHVLHAHLKEEG